MKEIEINGTKYYILGKGEQICIATDFSTNLIKIKNTAENLNISGCDQTLNDIIESDKRQSNLSLLEKCDSWLEMFYDVHDKFKAVALSKGYAKKNVIMELNFGEFPLSNNKKARTINLDLKCKSLTVEKGVTMSICDDNEIVYEYLLANVLEYYINENFIINPSYNLKIFNNENWFLYSSFNTKYSKCPPLIANLQLLHTSDSLTNLVKDLIECHNAGISTKAMISSLRNKVSKYMIPTNIDKSIDSSSQNHKHIMLKSYHSPNN